MFYFYVLYNVDDLKKNHTQTVNEYKFPGGCSDVHYIVFYHLVKIIELSFAV